MKCKKPFAVLFAVALGVALVAIPPVREGVVEACKWIANRGSDLAAWFQAQNQADEQAAKDKEPPEKRIERLRGEIGKIRGEVVKSVDRLVKMKLDLEEAQAKVSPLEKNKTARQDDLEVATAALEKATTEVSVQNKEKFKIRVIDATQKYNTAASTLDTYKKTVDSKRAAVEAFEKQIRTMQAREEQLNALADSLEAKLQELKLKQLENSVAVDNSKVSECEALAKQIERLLKEEERKTEAYKDFNLTNAPADTPREDVKSDEEVLKAAREALGRDKAKN
jgi:chromosome segregation ATPase